MSTNDDQNPMIPGPDRATRRREGRNHIDRQNGRLFQGKAPSPTLNEGRLVLFRRWDRIIAYFESRNPQDLLRFLRSKYPYWDRSRDPDCEPMRFLDALRAHNDLETRAGNRKRH